MSKIKWFSSISLLLMVVLTLGVTFAGMKTQPLIGKPKQEKIGKTVNKKKVQTSQKADGGSPEMTLEVQTSLKYSKYEIKNAAGEITGGFDEKKPGESGVVPGFVTVDEAKQGWVRSNDTETLEILLKPLSPQNKKFENVKVEISIEVENGYSDFAAGIDEKLENIKLTNVENDAPWGTSQNDSDQNLVKAVKTITFTENDYGAGGQGDLVSTLVNFDVKSAFNKTEMPVKITIKLKQADLNGETVEFTGDDYTYFADLPLENNENTFKVSSALRFRPVMQMSYVKNGINSIAQIAPLNDLLKNAADKNFPNDKAISVGYGWLSAPITEEERGYKTDEKLGLTVPKGNNRFQIGLSQKVIAEIYENTTGTSNKTKKKTLVLGPDGEFPYMTVFSYGKAGEEFGNALPPYTNLDYLQSILSREYPTLKTNATPYNFANTGLIAEQMLFDNQNGHIFALVNPTTFIPNLPPADTAYYAIGSYLVFRATEYDRTSAHTKATYSFPETIKQDYYLDILGGEGNTYYTDNDDTEIVPNINSKDKGASLTWSEIYTQNKIPEDKFSRVSFVKQDEQKKQIPGGKFYLQVQNEDGTWIDVKDHPGASNLDPNLSGELVAGSLTLSQVDLRKLFADIGEGPYRFRENEAPPGYLLPDNPYSETTFTLQDAVGAWVKVEYSPSLGSGNQITMTNVKKENELGATKEDANSGKPIEDVEFEVEYLASENPDQWVRIPDLVLTTDKNGKIKLDEEKINELRATYGNGRYRLVETTPAEGYLPPEGEDQYTYFEILEDTVKPPNLTITNEPTDDVESITKSIEVQSGYGKKDEIKNVFSKLPTLTTESNNDGNKNDYFISTNFAQTFQGEEYLAASEMDATYASSKASAPTVYNNWEAEEAVMLQLWNRQECDLIDASYNYFGAKNNVGDTEPIKYGIYLNNEPNANYPGTLSKIKLEDVYDIEKGEVIDTENRLFDWYDSIEEAETTTGKKVSAILGKMTNFSYDYATDQKVDTRWNLYTKRIATGEGKVSTSNSAALYTTFSRGMIRYKNPKTGKKVVVQQPDVSFSPVLFKEKSGSPTYPTVPTDPYGTTFFIFPHPKPNLVKTSFNTETSKPQTAFSLEDTIGVSLKTTFSAEDYSGNAKPFTITVEDNASKTPAGQAIQENFEYIKGSSTLNGFPIPDPEVIKTPEGETKYKWEVAVDLSSTSVYDLQFKAVPKRIGSFVNEMIADDPWYGTSPKPAEANLEITQTTRAAGIKKFTDTPVIEKWKASAPSELNPVINYQVLARNYLYNATIQNPIVMDVLPYNGDSHGVNEKKHSQFQGFFKDVGEITAENLLGESQNDRVEIYYSTESPADLKDFYYLAGDSNKLDIAKMNKQEIIDSGKWKKYDQIDDKGTITAFVAFLPTMTPGSSFMLNVSMTPQENEYGDRYYNSAALAFTVDDSFDFSEVFTLPTETVVVDRTLKGEVWIDNNYNGMIDPEEDLRCEGIPVRLFRQNQDTLEWEPYDNETITDDEGRYEFTSLPADYYQVGFDLSDSPYKDYLITKLGDPESPLSNKVSTSKVVVADNKTYHITDKNVEVPYSQLDTDGNLNPDIMIDGINMGLLAKPELGVKKSVYNDKNESIDGQSVKVGDTLRYEVEVTNPTENSYVANVQMTDSLPRGLKYKKGTLKLYLNGEQTGTALPDSYFNEAGTELQTDALGGIQGATTTTGQKIKISFEVEVTADANGKLTNIATATGELHPDGKDSNEVENNLAPDLSIQKISDYNAQKDPPPAPLKEGDRIKYTIDVSNAPGAATVKDATVTDTLPNYLEYVPDSTYLEDPKGANPIKQADSHWDGQKLRLNVGDLVGSASGVTKTIIFEVILKEMPEKDDKGIMKIVNPATVDGKDIDDKDLPQKDDEDIIYLDKQLNKAKIHVRQVVLDANEKLVVPTLGYLSMTQWKDADQPLVGSTSSLNINSIDQNKWKDKTLEEVKESFTTFSLALLPDQAETQFDLVIPEYYEYLGDGFTKELTADNLTTHTTDPKDPTVLRLALKDADEYWITLFITPSDKGKNPRPYSWDYKVNHFGKLKGKS